MKIKSIIDVITNSSSEVFVIKTGMKEKELRPENPLRNNKRSYRLFWNGRNN